MTRLVSYAVGLLAVAVLLSGCDDLLGSKSDPTTDEIFDAGRIEPGLISEVEYVPLFPFFTRGGDGAPLDAPQDVYVGFDELIYVVDARGLHVLDRSGRPAAFIPIEGGATNVIQDRRFHVYVTARRDTVLNGRTWNLPVVLHYRGLTTGAPEVVDVLWHPFDDDSRRNLRDPISTDEAVEFTGLAVLFNDDPAFNNSIYVSRRGPVNQRGSVIRPHNTILEYGPDGENTNAIVALNPAQPNLLSSVSPNDVLTFVHPPQRQRFAEDRSFYVAQSPYADGVAPDDPAARDSLAYAVLSIRAVETPDGIEYDTDSEKLIIAENPDRGDGFLYEEYKFNNPADLAFAADATNYLFVIDSGSDSLFVFTANGIEGVAPPPGATSTQPVVASFGGTGDGSTQFDDPQGVAYFNRVVYVADTGNNRISRFRLNTDFE